MQFSLLSRLQDLGVPAVSSRPSRSLADEPAVRCLLTWAKLAHPRWHFPCSREELRSALYQSIDDADLIKVDRLSRIVYKEKLKELTSFDDIDADIQLLISPAVGNRYEIIRNWLLEYVSADPADLDVFLSRLFGEVLSQPGFHMHNDLQQASVCERLIESARKFRHAQNPNEDAHPIDRGEAYIDMVLSGVIAATPTFDPSKNDGAILVAPAYAYLMQNRPVEIQVWLDVGARAWWERLFQPLTHPHVLSRHWTSARKWTDSDEVHYNQLMLERLVIGLTRRCKKQLVLHASGMNEQGYEDRGPLLRVIQTVLRALPRERAASDV
ncbi:MAG: hypothetical protein HPY76_14105 [Anaerolineae bacterium]|nr:hypothetical protein [Anaerolineae bacterium]